MIRVLPLVVATALVGCDDFPRDPQRTLQHVRGGDLRVGLVENRPWVIRSGDGPAGIEPDLVRELARELNANLHWQWSGEQVQMEALENHQLDLLLGGLTKRTPWKSRVGLTSTFAGNHVMATQRGENGWIKKLDEFLGARAAEIDGRLKQNGAGP